MKLKSTFITEKIGDTQIMAEVGPDHFKGIVRNNKTAAFIVDSLKKETTESDLVSALFAHYDVSEETAREDVRKVLETLRSIGAIEE